MKHMDTDIYRTQQGILGDRPWVIHIQEIGPGDEDRYEIKNLTEGELLWIHDALADKIRDVRNDLQDCNQFSALPDNTDAEDAMFLGLAIHKMARLIFLIKEEFSR